MNEIVRWTTPTVKITFQTIDVTEITQAYLTVRCNGSTITTKDITTMGTGEDFISWTLTQEETGKLTASTQVFICADWKLTDGTRGRSKTGKYYVVEAGVDEEI